MFSSAVSSVGSVFGRSSIETELNSPGSPPSSPDPADMGYVGQLAAVRQGYETFSKVSLGRCSYNSSNFKGDLVLVEVRLAMLVHVMFSLACHQSLRLWVELLEISLGTRYDVP